MPTVGRSLVRTVHPDREIGYILIGSVGMVHGGTEQVRPNRVHLMNKGAHRFGMWQGRYPIIAR